MLYVNDDPNFDWLMRRPFVSWSCDLHCYKSTVGPTRWRGNLLSEWNTKLSELLSFSKLLDKRTFLRYWPRLSTFWNTRANPVTPLREQKIHLGRIVLFSTPVLIWCRMWGYFLEKPLVIFFTRKDRGTQRIFFWKWAVNYRKRKFRRF